MSTGTIVLIVLSSARMVSNTGVFRFEFQPHHGDLIYGLPLTEEVRCLRACYEELECEVAHYNKKRRLCRLYRGGTEHAVNEYAHVLKREQTDFSCKTEAATGEIPFQKIETHENGLNMSCNNSVKLDVVAIQSYSHGNYNFFYRNTTEAPPNWKVGPRFLLSQKPEPTCTSVPVFHRANHRRLYFGEIYNTSGYYFYNAYAFAERCVSPNGECLGVQQIQEYVDNQDNFLYRNAGREDLKDSGLKQIFYIVGMEEKTQTNKGKKN